MWLVCNPAANTQAFSFKKKTVPYPLLSSYSGMCHEWPDVCWQEKGSAHGQK